MLKQPRNVLDLWVHTTNYPSCDRPSSNTWEDFNDAFRRRLRPLPGPWAEIFGPLREGAVDELMIVGQLGQSLDGRIATECGHSKYINGSDGLVHLHRLRALVDAVVIGAGSVCADDPQLTVRRVAGSHPVRVVIDPKGRLDANARVFADDGVQRLLLIAQGTHCTPSSGVEVVSLPVTEGQIAPATILTELARRGMRRILIEGGADTISRFLAAGCLDRLHVMIAPIILGAGPGLTLPLLERVDQAPRMPFNVHRIGDDVLLDCDLSAQRVVIGTAKKST